MNPDETFAADRSPFSSKMDFLSQLFALGGFEGLLLSKEKKPFGSRNFVHDESSQRHGKSGN